MEANRRALEVDRAKALRSEAHDLVVVDGVEGRGPVQDRGHVTGQIGLAGRGADDEGRDPPGRDDDVRFGGVHDRQGECAAHDQEALANGLHQFEPLRAELFDQVRQDLGVGDRGEEMAARLEALSEFRVVLDDAVVDDRDVARTVQVRVSVDRFRRPVRGPTRVADAGGEALRGG